MLRSPFANAKLITENCLLSFCYRISDWSNLSFVEKTTDGFEKMLQVNYLSHFIITAKLLPLMRSSGDDCRLLLMSSDAHRACSFDLNTMNYQGNPNSFGRLDYYGRSKLYQVKSKWISSFPSQIFWAIKSRLDSQKKKGEKKYSTQDVTNLSQHIYETAQFGSVTTVFRCMHILVFSFLTEEIP